MSKIVFWQAGDNDGCSFYRCQEPARVLATMGHETYSGRIMAPSVYEDADVMVAQRLSETGPSLIWAGLAEQGDHKLVYEIDDDLLSVPEHFGTVHEAYANPARRARVLMAMDRADVITTTNAHLAQAVRDHLGQPNKDVRVVPNYVPERLVVEAVPELPKSETQVVGWAGSGSHRQDFEQVIIPLRRVLRGLHAHVHIIGPDYAARLATAAPLQMSHTTMVSTGKRHGLKHTEWVDGVDGYMQALDFHVGLAPLLDDQFNRSKSDIKIKEYAARGIVAIASSVGPYALSTPLPRLIAEPHGGWTEALYALISNDAHRTHLADIGLEWARANTIEAHAIEWERALLS